MSFETSRAFHLYSNNQDPNAPVIRILVPQQSGVQQYKLYCSCDQDFCAPAIRSPTI